MVSHYNRIVFFFIALFTFNLSLFSQIYNQERYIDSINFMTYADSIQSQFDLDIVNPDYKLAAIAALSFYPELIDSKIVFKDRKTTSSSNARPNIFSCFFKKRHKRKYIISMNIDNRDSILKINNLSFNAKVGLIGHELAHVFDYSQSNIFRLIGRLFSYAFKNKRQAYEKETDSQTIARGMGWQLYDWSTFVLYESCATEKYKSFKKQYYLKPEEIKKKIISP